MKGQAEADKEDQKVVPHASRMYAKCLPESAMVRALGLPPEPLRTDGLVTTSQIP